MNTMSRNNPLMSAKVVKIDPILYKVIEIDRFVNATTILINKNNEDFEGNGPYLLKLKPINCKRCKGTGKTLYGSLENACFTQSDFDDDPDLLHNLQSGMYDVTCVDCNGCGITLHLQELNEDENLQNNINILNTIKKMIKNEIEYINETKRESEMGY